MNTTYNLDFKADRLPQRGVKKCESPVNDFSHLKYVFLHSVRHLTRRLEFAAMAATPLAHRPQARVGLDSSASFLRVAACHSDRLDSEGQAVRAVRARTGSPLAPCPAQPLPEAWQVFRRWIWKWHLRRGLPLPSVSTETCSQCPGQRGFAWARCTLPSRLFQGLCGLQHDLGFPPAIQDPNLFFKKMRALVSPHCGRRQDAQNGRCRT